VQKPEDSGGAGSGQQGQSEEGIGATPFNYMKMTVNSIILRDEQRFASYDKKKATIFQQKVSQVVTVTFFFF